MRQSTQRKRASGWEDAWLAEARERVDAARAEMEALFARREPTFAEKHGSKVLVGLMLIVIPTLAILGAVFDR